MSEIRLGDFSENAAGATGASPPAVMLLIICGNPTLRGDPLRLLFAWELGWLGVLAFRADLADRGDLDLERADRFEDRADLLDRPVLPDLADLGDLSPRTEPPIEELRKGSCKTSFPTPGEPIAA